MKENIVDILENFKGQIQCQNARIKVIDSSLIKINMLMKEHLIYENKMVHVMVDAWLVMEFKDNLYLIINCSNKLLNCPILFSKIHASYDRPK